MTMQEYRSAMELLAKQYKGVLHQDAPDANILNAIEAKLKQAKSDAASQRASEIISDAMRYTNPIVECARNAQFSYPSYKMDREKGVVTGISIIEATGQVKVQDICKRVVDVSAMKNNPYEKTGVCKNGHAWEYRAEKLAFLMAQSVAGGLEIDKSKMVELEKFYKMSAEARKQDLGKDPFSNRQMTKTLQDIVDLLVFVPTGEGKNAIKVATRDVKYLKAIFQKAGRDMGDVKTLKGRNMAQYIFAIVHMIVTGEAYTVDGVGGGESGRAPIPVSKMISGQAEQAEEPETIVVQREASDTATTEDESREEAA